MIPIFMAFLFFINCNVCRTGSRRLQFQEQQKIKEEMNKTLHEHLEQIREQCADRERFCRANVTTMCAVREEAGRQQYKDFNNVCELFFANTCDHPGHEFFITWGGNCTEFFKMRRSAQQTVDIEEGEDLKEPSVMPEKQEPLVTEDTQEPLVTEETQESPATSETQGPLSTQDTEEPLVTQEPQGTAEENTVNNLLFTDLGKEILRMFEFTDSYVSEYKVKRTSLNKICPHSCTNVYDPYCATINRNAGKYTKVIPFRNRCYLNVFNCRFPEVFSAVPGKPSSVFASGLSYPLCSSPTFNVIHRFTQEAESMNRYGWLEGHQRAKHIMKPHERLPGFG